MLLIFWYPNVIKIIACNSLKKLKQRTPDMTRGTVQKSVCVLSDVPLFGHIQVKMELITHAYFDEGDFSKVSLLQDTYYHLNSCLSQIDNLQSAPQLFVGMSAFLFFPQSLGNVQYMK